MNGPSFLLRAALMAVLGVAALIAASYASVPMYPVPMTLQTMAVLLVGALAGSRLGAGVVIAWLALALLGLPVLSGGKTGLAALTGPTAGFLFAFPVAAFLAGLLPSWQGPRGIARYFGAFLALHGLILLIGWARLALLIGAETAFMSGAGPFLPGAAVKSALAALIAVWAAPRLAIAARTGEA